MLGVGILAASVHAAPRALLRRRGRLRDDLRHPVRQRSTASAAAHPLRGQAARDLADARLGRVGRRLFSVALHGRDARRRVRGRAEGRSSRACSSPAAFALAGMAGRRRGRDRRGAHGDRDDLRDDARLLGRPADDPDGGRELRPAPLPLPREHLHDEADAARALHAASAPGQRAPRPSCRRT